MRFRDKNGPLHHPILKPANLPDFLTVARREVINGLLRKAGAAISDGKQALDLEAPLDLSRMFLDTTCVKANIHFPVDWVLMRDGVKSLMQSVELIRSHGLKSRIWILFMGSGDKEAGLNNEGAPHSPSRAPPGSRVRATVRKSGKFAGLRIGW